MFTKDEFIEIKLDINENINKITQNYVKVCPNILNFLDNIQGLFDKLNNKLSTIIDLPKDESYSVLKQYIQKYSIKKVFHFPHYNDYKSPFITILYIFNTLVTELTKFITLYYYHLSKNYSETYLVNWMEQQTNNYDKICSQINNNLPCMEAFVEDLLKINRNIESVPVKPKQSIISNKMTESDFTTDGEFDLRYGGILEDFENWQLIAITLRCFKIALCGIIDDCINNKHQEIRQFYNLDNYKTYLNKIDFFNRTNIRPEDFMRLLEGYDYVPEPSDLDGQFVCCLKDLREMMGGKNKYFYKYLKYKNKYINTNK